MGGVGRLRGRRAFDRVFRHGRAFAGRLVVVRYLQGAGPARVGVAVAAGVRGAVRRNRLRRRWREVIRRGPALRPGFEVVVVGRAAGEGRGFGELQEAWAQALARTGLGDGG